MTPEVAADERRLELLLGPDGVVLSGGHSPADLFGITAAEAVGKNAAELVDVFALWRAEGECPYLSPTYLLNYPPTYLPTSAYPTTNLSNYPPTNLPAYSSTDPPTHPPTHLPPTHPLPTHLPTHLSTYLPTSCLTTTCRSCAAGRADGAGQARRQPPWRVLACGRHGQGPLTCSYDAGACVCEYIGFLNHLPYCLPGW